MKNVSLVILIFGLFLPKAFACGPMDWSKDQKIETVQKKYQGLTDILILEEADLSKVDCPFSKLEELSYASELLKKDRNWESVQDHMRLYQIGLSANWKKDLGYLLISSSVMEVYLLEYFATLTKHLQSRLEFKTREIPIEFIPKTGKVVQLRYPRQTYTQLQTRDYLKRTQEIVEFLLSKLIEKQGCGDWGGEGYKLLNLLGPSNLMALENHWKKKCPSNLTLQKIQRNFQKYQQSPQALTEKSLKKLNERGIYLEFRKDGPRLVKEEPSPMRDGTYVRTLNFHQTDFLGDHEFLEALKLFGIGKLANPDRKEAFFFYSQVFLPPIKYNRGKNQNYLLSMGAIQDEVWALSKSDFAKVQRKKNSEEQVIHEVLERHGLIFYPQLGLDFLGEEVKSTLSEVLGDLKALTRERPSKKLGMTPLERFPVQEFIDELEKLHAPRKKVLRVGKNLLALPPHKGMGGKLSVALITDKEYLEALEITLGTFNSALEQMSTYLKVHDGFKGTYARYWTKVSEDFNILEKTSKDASAPRRVIFEQNMSLIRQSLKRFEGLGAFDMLGKNNEGMALTPEQQKAMRELIPKLEKAESVVESSMVSSLIVVPLVSAAAIVGLAKLPIVALGGMLLGFGIESGRQIVEIKVDGHRKEISLSEIYQSGVIGAAFSNVAAIEKLRPFLLVAGGALAVDSVSQEIAKGHFGTAVYDGVVSVTLIGASSRTCFSKKGPVDEFLNAKELKILGYKPGMKIKFSELATFEKNKINRLPIKLLDLNSAPGKHQNVGPQGPKGPGIVPPEVLEFLGYKKGELVLYSELPAHEMNQAMHFLATKEGQTGKTLGETFVDTVVRRTVLRARQKVGTDGRVKRIFIEEEEVCPQWKNPLPQNVTTAPDKEVASSAQTILNKLSNTLLITPKTNLETHPTTAHKWDSPVPRSNSTAGMGHWNPPATQAQTSGWGKESGLERVIGKPFLSFIKNEEKLEEAGQWRVAIKVVAKEAGYGEAEVSVLEERGVLKISSQYGDYFLGEKTGDIEFELDFDPETKRIYGSVNVESKTGLGLRVDLLRRLYQGDPQLHPLRRREGAEALAPFQEEMVQEIRNTQNDKNVRALVMPTGAGKTYTSLNVWGNKKKYVFLVNNKDILDSTARTYKKGLKLDEHKILRLYGKSAAQKIEIDVGEVDLILSTRVTAARRFHELEKYFEEGDWVFVLDEVHHANSEEYQAILKKIEGLQQKARANGKVAPEILALTATFWNDDEEFSLKNFGENIHAPFLTNLELEELRAGERVIQLAKVQLFRAMRDGYLSQIKNVHIVETIHGVQTSEILTGLEEKKEEVKEEQVEKDRQKIIQEGLLDSLAAEIKALQKAGIPHRGLIFVPSISHAKEYIKFLNEKGNGKFHEYHSELSMEKREELLLWMKDNKSQENRYFLVVDTFNEGTDVQSVNLVVMLRNYSMSKAGVKRFLQNLGRGTRLLLDKDGFPKIGFDLLDYSGISRVLADVLLVTEDAGLRERGERKPFSGVKVVVNGQKVSLEHFRKNSLNLRPELFSYKASFKPLTREQKLKLQKHFSVGGVVDNHLTDLETTGISGHNGLQDFLHRVLEKIEGSGETHEEFKAKVKEIIENELKSPLMGVGIRESGYKCEVVFEILRLMAEKVFIQDHDPQPMDILEDENLKSLFLRLGIKQNLSDAQMKEFHGHFQIDSTIEHHLASLKLSGLTGINNLQMILRAILEKFPKEWEGHEEFKLKIESIIDEKLKNPGAGKVLRIYGAKLDEVYKIFSIMAERVFFHFEGNRDVKIYEKETLEKFFKYLKIHKTLNAQDFIKFVELFKKDDLIDQQLKHLDLSGLTRPFGLQDFLKKVLALIPAELEEKSILRAKVEAIIANQLINGSAGTSLKRNGGNKEVVYEIFQLMGDVVFRKPVEIEKREVMKEFFDRIYAAAGMTNAGPILKVVPKASLDSNGDLTQDLFRAKGVIDDYLKGLELNIIASPGGLQSFLKKVLGHIPEKDLKTKELKERINTLIDEKLPSSSAGDSLKKKGSNRESVYEIFKLMAELVFTEAGDPHPADIAQETNFRRFLKKLGIKRRMTEEQQQEILELFRPNGLADYYLDDLNLKGLSVDFGLQSYLKKILEKFPNATPEELAFKVKVSSLIDDKFKAKHAAIILRQSGTRSEELYMILMVMAERVFVRKEDPSPEQILQKATFELFFERLGIKKSSKVKESE